MSENTQLNLRGVLRDHVKRIRILENASPFSLNGFFEWIDLDDVEITVASGVGPTVASFTGKYICMPAPGVDPNRTAVAFVQFSLVLGDPGSSTAPWNIYMPEADRNLTANSMFGNGRLIHTDAFSSGEINYAIDFGDTEGTSRGLQMTSPGVEPAPGSIPSGYDPGFVRLTYPCTIVEGDIIRGWFWGLVADGVA